jgi:hypothetical protein
MDRLYYFLICVILLSIPTAAKAQNHMKFLGIEMNMTINEFQKRLVTKNIHQVQDYYSDGERMYSGKLMGENCQFYLHFKSDSIVYEGIAVYSSQYQSSCDNFVEHVKSLLRQKYRGSNFFDTIDEEGNPDFSVFVNDPTSHKQIGLIDIWTSIDSDDDSNIEYVVHLKYIDNANYAEVESKNMEDL